MKECYAFYEERDVTIRKELLLEHLKDVYECMRKLLITKRVATKYAFLIGDLGRTDLYAELISLSGLLHDIGKGFFHYQQHHSYTCHELITSALIKSSTCIKYKINEDVLLKGIRAFPRVRWVKRELVEAVSVMLLIAIPILIHHYSQHESDFWRKLSLKDQSICPKEGLGSRYSESCKGVIEEIKELISNGSLGSLPNSKVLNVIIYALDELNKVRYEEADNRFGILKEIVKDLRNEKVCYYCDIVLAVTGILNSCDGKVAITKRALPSRN